MIFRKPLAKFLVALFIVLGCLLFERGYTCKLWTNLGFVQLNQTLTGDLLIAARTEDTLQRAITSCQNESDFLWLGLGFARISQGLESKAMSAWTHSSQASPMLLQEGAKAQQAGKVAKALLWYTRAKTLTPNWPEPYYRMGQVYRSQRRWPQAISVLTEAIALAPNNRSIWYELGWAYMGEQQKEEALSALEKALVATDGELGLSVVYHRIGRLYQLPRHFNEPDLALIQYQQALAVDDYRSYPELKVETYYEIGNVLSAQSNWPDAIAMYRQAITVNPAQYRLYLALAEALWQSRERDEAKMILQEAIALQPNQADAYLALETFYQESGDLIEAQIMRDKLNSLDQ